jgi:hypothetical protein
MAIAAIAASLLYSIGNAVRVQIKDRTSFV